MLRLLRSEHSTRAPRQAQQVIYGVVTPLLRARDQRR